MLGELRTGPIISADGARHPARSARDGAQVVTLGGGKYKEESLRGNIKYSYCADMATSVPATAMIGNIVWNPPGSGINLVLGMWKAQIHVTSASTTGIALAYGAQAITPTTVTLANSYGSTLLNAGTPGNCIAKAYAIGTLLVVPTIIMNLWHNTAAIATTGVDMMEGDIDGLFTVAPGYVVCLAALGSAVAAGGMTSTLTWEEIPI